MMNNDQLRELAERSIESYEATIIDQLNDFISRGLIVIRKGPTHIYEDISVMGKNRIKIAHEVELQLRDKEYIESLEKANNELRTRLDSIKEAVGGLV